MTSRGKSNSSRCRVAMMRTTIGVDVECPAVVIAAKNRNLDEHTLVVKRVVDQSPIVKQNPPAVRFDGHLLRRHRARCGSTMERSGVGCGSWISQSASHCTSADGRVTVLGFRTP